MKDYYELTKSGLVFGNLITVIAGFLLGARVLQGMGGALSLDLWRLFATLAGIALVMAGGCVFNNFIDRDIDVRMARTEHRALVEHRVSGRAAFVFASALSAAGFLILVFFANLLAVGVALAGFVFYVFAYSMWGKRRTVYGTFLGAVAGATPPVVGYAAVSGRIDAAAIVLFLIMITWQMPHFFAIAIRRKDDYAAAGIPVMPVSRGIRRTKVSMATYIAEFVVVSSLLFMFGYAGYAYLAVALVFGIAWLAAGLRGFWIPDADVAGDGAARVSDADRGWARNMFFFSLVVMMATFITIAIGAIV